MKRPDRQRWAGLIYWGVMLASLAGTVGTVGKVIRDNRSGQGLELSAVSLDAQPRAGVPISGRALLVNLTGEKISMDLAGNTHAWVVWTANVPDQIMPEAQTIFYPCGAQPAPSELEVAPGPGRWCFHQSAPLLDAEALEQLRKPEGSRLWFAAFIKYRTGDGKVHHARLCQVYNFAADRFERSRRESCDWFD